MDESTSSDVPIELSAILASVIALSIIFSVDITPLAILPCVTPESASENCARAPTGVPLSKLIDVLLAKNALTPAESVVSRNLSSRLLIAATKLEASALKVRLLKFPISESRALMAWTSVAAESVSVARSPTSAPISFDLVTQVLIGSDRLITVCAIFIL